MPQCEKELEIGDSTVRCLERDGHTGPCRVSLDAVRDSIRRLAGVAKDEPVEELSTAARQFAKIGRNDKLP